MNIFKTEQGKKLRITFGNALACGHVVLAGIVMFLVFITESMLPIDEQGKAIGAKGPLVVCALFTITSTLVCVLTLTSLTTNVKLVMGDSHLYDGLNRDRMLARVGYCFSATVAICMAILCLYQFQLHSGIEIVSFPQLGK